ncbi:MAG: bleomycin resistance protein [Chloroflexi bacterium]|nr:bleomycin resistance protein [Chloroflexota bacterium]
MEAPGLHHIIMTVSNLERSRAFYGDLLGFKISGSPEEGYFLFIAGGVMFFFGLSHHPIPEDRFSEFRIGLDHLSFKAPSMEILQNIANNLKMAGVPTQGVETYAPTGTPYVAFRDPDNIQLEYWLDQP